MKRMKHCRRHGAWTLSAELARDIRERINPRILDSLLTEEFQSIGVSGGFHSWRVLRDR